MYVISNKYQCRASTSETKTCQHALEDAHYLLKMSVEGCYRISFWRNTLYRSYPSFWKGRNESLKQYCQLMNKTLLPCLASSRQRRKGNLCTKRPWTLTQSRVTPRSLHWGRLFRAAPLIFKVISIPRDVSRTLTRTSRSVTDEGQVSLRHNPRLSTNTKPTYPKWGYIVSLSSRWHLWRSTPAHNWTPMIPKMKKTKKQRRRTLPSIGRVSRRSITKILMPEKKKQIADLLRARNEALPDRGMA